MGMVTNPTRHVLLPLLLGCLAVGCGGSQVTTVPLLTAAGIPVSLTPSPDVPLEVVTRSTAVRDPLPVDGSSVAFADIEGALGHAVSSAAVPWAEAHRAQRPEGWELVVEVIQAESSYRDGRLAITLNTRATLRTRVGSEYLAQTNTRCREAGLTTPETGGPVVYACMTHLGRDLAGWLGGVEP
jgi:hypothetical protein